MHHVHSFLYSLRTSDNSVAAQAAEPPNRISDAAIPKIVGPHIYYFLLFAPLTTNNPQNQALPTAASAINQSFAPLITNASQNQALPTAASAINQSFAPLITNAPQNQALPTAASAINQSDEQKLKAILQSWLNDPQAEGDKKTAASRIRDAYQRGSEELKLSNLRLTIILPEIFSFLSKVKKLDLCYNRLSSLLIPQGSLPNLERLNLSCNQISNLHFSKGACSKMRDLDVEHNQISDPHFSEDVRPELKWLNLDYNQISNLHFSKGDYPGLEVLRVAYNQISNLHFSKGDYPGLKVLSVSYNQISNLHFLEDACHELELLCADHNQISNLHFSKGACSKMRHLNVEHNQISNLHFLEDTCHELWYLNVSYNQISNLHFSKGACSKMRHLNVEHNQISNLCLSEDAYHEVEELILSHNQILGLDFPEGVLIKLKYLWISDNQISNLRLSENTCPELQELDASRNRILSFSVGACPRLQNLRLDNNPNLTDLPIALRNASNLTYLSCGNTQIPREQVDAILKAVRDLQIENQLPQQLDLWAFYANLSPEEKNNLSNSILKLSSGEKIEITNWLLRLEETSDFCTNQKGLAATVCSILKDAGANTTFRNQLIVLAGANRTDCADRAATGLNQIYVSWKTMCVDQRLPLRDKLQIIIGAAKTAALWLALSQEIGEADKRGVSLPESTETYLYYEHTLAKDLGLMTAVQSMLHSDIGKRDWINEEHLKQAVEANYLNQAISFPALDALIQNDPEAKKKLDQIHKKFSSEQEKTYLLKTDNEFLVRNKELQEQRDREQAKVKKDWLIKALKYRKYRRMSGVPILLHHLRGSDKNSLDAYFKDSLRQSLDYRRHRRNARRLAKLKIGSLKKPKII